MVQIIKKGTKQTIKCGKCGCEFSFEAEDISREVTKDSFNGMKEFIKCPQCQNECIVKATK